MVRVEAKTSRVVADLHRVSAALPLAVARRERHYRRRLADAVRSHATHRPGPEDITGEYMDSIGVRGQFVGTDDPRGGRIEHGYHGDPDQHGPYPHFEPAIAEVGPAFGFSLERLVTELLG